MWSYNTHWAIANIFNSYIILIAKRVFQLVEKRVVKALMTALLMRRKLFLYFSTSKYNVHYDAMQLNEAQFNARQCNRI